LRRERLRSVSLKTVVAGFLSWLVGAAVIVLFGYIYKPNDWSGGPINRVGVTAMFWVGVTIIIFGVAFFLGGIALFYLSLRE